MTHLHHFRRKRPAGSEPLLLEVGGQLFELCQIQAPAAVLLFLHGAYEPSQFFPEALRGEHSVLSPELLNQQVAQAALQLSKSKPTAHQALHTIFIQPMHWRRGAFTIKRETELKAKLLAERQHQAPREHFQRCLDLRLWGWSDNTDVGFLRPSAGIRHL